MTIKSVTHISLSGIGALAILALGAQFSLASAAQKTKPVPYAKVAPLFKANCEKCHNATRHAEGVDLSSYAAIKKGGEKGPIVVANHPEKSDLYLYVDGTKKPQMPIAGKPLKADDLALIKKWIASGASK